MADCVYVTRGWGVHDERWSAALRTLRHDPAVVSLDRELTEAELRDAVAQASSGGLPVLAGPLGAVTRHLVGLPTRVVGLSWGFDLHELAAAGDTDWLSDLDGLIVDSDATRAIAVNAGVRPDRITFLPWGIELGDFAPDGPRTQFIGPTVLSLRAHEPLYRVDDIVRAFAIVAATVREARLAIGHAGSGTSALRDLVDDLALADRVEFIGTVEETGLAPLLRGAACYVTASSVDGTSVTLLQAMACRTPVVASSTPGNLGWIEAGVTGRIFPTGDIDAMAAAIVATLNDSDPASLTRAQDLVVANADWSRNIARLDAALFTGTNKS